MFKIITNEYVREMMTNIIWDSFKQTVVINVLFLIADTNLKTSLCTAFSYFVSFSVCSVFNCFAFAGKTLKEYNVVKKIEDN